MDEFKSLSHPKWEYKYHVVFIPKCRHQMRYKQSRRHLGEVFHDLAQRKQSRIEKGHLMADHVHMLISIPPKYAVSQVVGYLKGKSAIHLARVYGERKRPISRFDRLTNYSPRLCWGILTFAHGFINDGRVRQSYINQTSKVISRIPNKSFIRNNIFRGSSKVASSNLK